jgi:RimJ/RimL family protein N-acetyltransferase
MVAPDLFTGRLQLRHYRLSDFDPFADYFASPRSRYTDGPVARERAWDLFASGAGRWSLLGYGAWAVERQADGATVGLVSLNPPFAVGEPELGWILWDGFEGQGYAREAANAALNFAWQELGWSTLISAIHAENERSVRLAEQLGARFDPEVRHPSEPETRFYRFRRPSDGDWTNSR